MIAPRRRDPGHLIDLFSLALTHALLLLAAWRLVTRADLDREPDPPAPGPYTDA